MNSDQTILLFYQLETSLYHAVANLLTDWKWPETEISPSFDFLLIGFLPHRISYSGMKTRAGPHFKADPPWPLTTFAKQSKLQIENRLITIETDEIQSLSWLRYMDVWFFRTSWHLKSRNCIKSIWHFCVFFCWRFEAEKIFSDKKNPFRKYLFQMDFNPLLFLPKLYCFKADIFDEAILSPFRTRDPFIDRFRKSLVKPHSKFVSLYRYSLRWWHHAFWLVHILNWSPWRDHC